MFAPSSSRGFPRRSGKFQGGWLDLAIAGVSALLDHGAKKKADRQAAADRQRELDIEQGQLDLAKTQDARAGELFKHYTETYEPREKQLVSEAFDRPISPARAEARSLADVRGAFSTARASGDRNLRRLGVDPTSGNALALREQGGLEEARIEAGARTSAREGVRDQNFSRQATVLGYANPSAAGGYASSAQAGMNGVSELAAMRSRGSAAGAYESSSNYGAAIGTLEDAGLAAWRNRQRKSSGVEVEPSLVDIYKGYA